MAHTYLLARGQGGGLLHHLSCGDLPSTNPRQETGVCCNPYPDTILKRLTSSIELRTLDSTQMAASHHDFFIMKAGAEIPSKRTGGYKDEE
jgi:hypothetical protein